MGWTMAQMPTRFHRALRQQFSAANPDNPRFRCCCGSCHVTTGGVAIAVTKIFFSLLYAIRGIIFAVYGEMDYTWSGVLTFALAVVALVVLSMLLVGILKEQPLLLLPYVVYQLCTIVLQFIMAIVCLLYLYLDKRNLLVATQATDYQLIDLESDELRYLVKLLVYVALALYVSGASLGCWFVYVIVRIYVYLVEKRRFGGPSRSLSPAGTPTADAIPTELQILTPNHDLHNNEDSFT